MDVFNALADPIRRDLLWQLSDEKEQRVVDLAGRYDISRPAISKHLRLLGQAGLVAVETRGRERHYRLTREGLRPAIELLQSLQPATPPVSSQVLDALDLEVRRTTRDRTTRERVGDEQSKRSHSIESEGHVG